MLGNRRGGTGRVSSMSPIATMTRSQAPSTGSAPTLTSRDGAGAELETVYREHYVRLVRLAYTLTGRRHVAEELVQDAFIQADRKWATVRHYDDPVGWVRRVVVNRCTDTHRRTGSERRALMRVLTTDRLDRRELSDVASRAEPDSELWVAVRSLPDQQSAVIALVYVEGLDVVEAAATLGISDHTARTHLARAKAKLAGQLKHLHHHSQEGQT